MASSAKNSHNYDITTVVPEHIRVNYPEMMEFLDAYYHWLNTAGNPARILNSLPDYRDIDRCAAPYLEYIQREIAVSIPESIAANKRKLYKNVVDIYLSRGSTPSYVTLFKLVFNDEIDLFFPRVDILKPSDGKWDPVGQRWTSDDGKLSVKKFIQDSRYYQSFSYVIKTGQTIEKWRDAVKKLLHPAGFGFFGQVVIYTEAVTDFSPQKTSAKMPTAQPGRAATSDFPFQVVSGPTAVTITVGALQVTVMITSKPLYVAGPTYLHLEQNKFYINNPVSDYSTISILDIQTGDKKNIVPSADITITQNP